MDASLKTARPIRIAAVLFAAALSCGAAQAFELTYSVRGSTYGVSGTENAADLYTAFDAGGPVYCDEQSLDSFVMVNTGATCGSGNSDLADFISLEVDLAAATVLEFELGTDWGRGGALLVDGAVHTITSDDIWWGYDWNNADVINSVLSLSGGVHTLEWIGFESCCNGARSLRYSADGGQWQDLTAANFSSLEAVSSTVPTAAVWGLMLGGLVAWRGLRRT
ncbi:MAG: CCXG family PEP-CTERM protein [Gammaproteobacteria bacterium]